MYENITDQDAYVKAHEDSAAALGEEAAGIHKVGREVAEIFSQLLTGNTRSVAYNEALKAIHEKDSSSPIIAAIKGYGTLYIDPQSSLQNAALARAIELNEQVQNLQSSGWRVSFDVNRSDDIELLTKLAAEQHRQVFSDKKLVNGGSILLARFGWAESVTVDPSAADPGAIGNINVLSNRFASPPAVYFSNDLKPAMDAAIEKINRYLEDEARLMQPSADGDHARNRFMLTDINDIFGFSMHGPNLLIHRSGFSRDTEDKQFIHRSAVVEKTSGRILALVDTDVDNRPLAPAYIDVEALAPILSGLSSERKAKFPDDLKAAIAAALPAKADQTEPDPLRAAPEEKPGASGGSEAKLQAPQEKAAEKPVSIFILGGLRDAYSDLLQERGYRIEKGRRNAVPGIKSVWRIYKGDTLVGASTETTRFKEGDIILKTDPQHAEEFEKLLDDAWARVETQQASKAAQPATEEKVQQSPEPAPQQGMITVEVPIKDWEEFRRILDDKKDYNLVNTGNGLFNTTWDICSGVDGSRVGEAVMTSKKVALTVPEDPTEHAEYLRGLMAHVQAMKQPATVEVPADQWKAYRKVIREQDYDAKGNKRNVLPGVTDKWRVFHEDARIGKAVRAGDKVSMEVPTEHATKLEEAKQNIPKPAPAQARPSSRPRIEPATPNETAGTVGVALATAGLFGAGKLYADKVRTRNAIGAEPKPTGITFAKVATVSGITLGTALFADAVLNKGRARTAIVGMLSR